MIASKLFYGSQTCDSILKLQNSNFYAFSHCRGRQALLHTKNVQVLLTKFLKTRKVCCCNQFFTSSEKKSRSRSNPNAGEKTCCSNHYRPFFYFTLSRSRRQLAQLNQLETQMPIKDLHQSSLFFLQNLPKCPFFPPDDFWYLWIIPFYKSKKIFTAKNSLQCCWLFGSLTIQWR